MFECVKPNKIDDYFKPYSERDPKGVYCCRLIAYHAQIEVFLERLLEETKKEGVYIRGKIPNPDEKQLAFFEEIMGLEFRLDPTMLEHALGKWLPRIALSQRGCIRDALYEILSEMASQGKTVDMLRNAYIKFMCWFYYKFERILNSLGKERLPKVLYEGDISPYELKMVSILARAGCDILLLQTHGDEAYQKVDPKRQWTSLIEVEGGQPFPKEFSLLNLEQKTQKEISGNPSQKSVLITEPPQGVLSTNTWITGNVLQDTLKKREERGGNPSYYYNLFVLECGVEDKTNYAGELLRWKLKLDGTGRAIVLTEGSVKMPDAVEVQKIQRKNYLNEVQLIGDMAKNILFPKCKELERLAKRAFVELLQAEREDTLQKLVNRAVCLLCWLNRYVPKLFPQWELQSLPVFVHYGSCGNRNEELFFRLLARLPVDVCILCPDLSLKEPLEDPLLFRKDHAQSLPLGPFPTDLENVRFGTVAYQAERDLDTMLYQDSGIYRNRQFKKAIPIELHTTYEEIGILWDQESYLRPNFEVLTDRVMVPVIFAKVSGVPGGNKEAYWRELGKLVVEDTVVITELPHLGIGEDNPMKPHAVQFLKNGKLQVDKILNHPSYPYGFVREEMQDYMFDKLQELLDRKLIEGTFSRGVEYTIVSVALHLEKQILRLIQKFDFTKKVPKVLLISTGETLGSLEDSILTVYLSLLGFDVVLFVPTGYQSVERYFTQPMMARHEVGEYMYDMKVPDLKRMSKVYRKESLADRLFRRGR